MQSNSTPLFKHKYKCRTGCQEMLVSIESDKAQWDSLENFEKADLAIQAAQVEAGITGKYDNPLHQPITLN